MNELAGFPCNRRKHLGTTFNYSAAAVAVARRESAISISTFPPASIIQPRANTLSSKDSPWRSSDQTAVNSLCARAILATCAGFRFRSRA